MADYLVSLSQDPRSAGFLKKLGLPMPVSLARVVGGTVAQPMAGHIALLLAAPDSYATPALAAALEAAGAEVCSAEQVSADYQLPIVVMDATGCSTVPGLRALFDGLQPVVKRLRKNARILLLATRPDAVTEPVAAGCARAVEGFTRSLAKEVGKLGCTVNLAYLEPGAVPHVRGVVEFFCSPRCTYVTGQTVTLRPPLYTAHAAWKMRYLSGKTAVVTGCARGIGRAIAHRLAEEGAHVIGIDVASARDALYELCLQIGGTPLLLDIAEDGAADELAALIDEKFDAVDVVVHNAGITRDKTLANMTPVQWDMVLDINFAAIARIDQTLLNRALVHDAGRIICLSSISGIAGNFGQTNYAASKAALMAYVEALGRGMAARGITANAVAPGFIETPMTQKVPVVTRELGRRLNALSQGGQPRDVAELVCFLASPGAAAITGNTIRVCGQAMMGA